MRGESAPPRLQVTLLESSCLVGLYFLYTIVMVYNNEISEWVSKKEALYIGRRLARIPEADPPEVIVASLARALLL